jgi:purine-binding chemotaxis protein CheW
VFIAPRRCRVARGLSYARGGQQGGRFVRKPSVSIQTSASTDDAMKSSGFRSEGGATNGDGLIEFISFSIGEDQYGVAIMSVREIKGWSGVTHLPKQPDYVRGVLNLRGVMVPIIDLRCRFGQGMTEASSMHVVIIVQIEDRLVGLLADRVLDIVSYEGAKIQPVPRMNGVGEGFFLSGLITIDDAMIALIDLEHLLNVNIDVTQARNEMAMSA